MPDPTQFNPDRLRVALDHGEVVELDGGTLVLDTGPAARSAARTSEARPGERAQRAKAALDRRK